MLEDGAEMVDGAMKLWVSCTRLSAFALAQTTLLQDHHSRAMCCTYEIEQRHRLTGRRLHIKYTRNDADERKRRVYCGGCAGLEVQRWCIVDFEVEMPSAGEEEI